MFKFYVYASKINLSSWRKGERETDKCRERMTEKEGQINVEREGEREGEIHVEREGDREREKEI